MTPGPHLTALLTLASRGDPEASAEAIRLVYDRLYEIARERCGPKGGWDGFSPTMLVHEAYLRLVDGRSAVEWNDRSHFFAVAAIVMRRIVLDSAKARGRLKRGEGWRRIPLEAIEAQPAAPAYDPLELADALRRLAERRPRQASIAEWRIFVGLSHPQIARLLGVSVRTVEAEWALARAELMRELGDGPPP